LALFERKQTLPILSNVLIGKTQGKNSFYGLQILKSPITTTIDAGKDDSTNFNITLGGKKLQEFSESSPTKPKYDRNQGKQSSC